MKNKLYSLIGLLACVLAMPAAKGQCPANRYLTQVFTTYTVDTVTYSTTYNQQMDIYQPVGDTMAHRPLMILAHGGAFITTGGYRHDDPTINQMVIDYVKKGFVTVSIDYRLASPLTMLDSAAAIDEVAKAISDGKAAIRYFTKDAATTNTYKIDTNHIFVGGNSAGAVLYMHANYIDSLGECPGYLQSTFNNNGGFEGNSGNAGYPTKFQAVINLAGGLNKVAFVSPGDKPSVNMQGDLDNTVPYYCAHALSGNCPVTLCGLGELEAAYNANSIYHVSHVFHGQGHVPWSSNAAIFDTMNNMVTQFVYSLICTNAQGVGTVTSPAIVSLYPNPAYDVINVSSSRTVSSLSVCDVTGRVVKQIDNVNKTEYQVSTANFKQGIYFLKVTFAHSEGDLPVTRKFVIQ